MSEKIPEYSAPESDITETPPQEKQPGGVITYTPDQSRVIRESLNAVFGETGADRVQSEKKISPDENGEVSRMKHIEVVAAVCDKLDPIFRDLGKDKSAGTEVSFASTLTADWFEGAISIPQIQFENKVILKDILESFKRDIAKIAAVKFFGNQMPKNSVGEELRVDYIKELFELKVEEETLRLKISLLEQQILAENNSQTITRLNAETFSKDVTTYPKFEFTFSGETKELIPKENGENAEVSNRAEFIERYSALVQFLQHVGYSFDITKTYTAEEINEIAFSFANEIADAKLEEDNSLEELLRLKSEYEEKSNEIARAINQKMSTMI